MKLALGTVQFGLRYGIANTTGQVTPQEIAAILATARASGVDMLDTAIAYGDSEAQLGAAGIAGFHVVSKLPKLDGGPDDICAMVEGAITRLGVDTLYGLLLHRSEDLVGPEGAEVYASMAQLKKRGLVQKIGVSIYGPAELDSVMSQFDIDLVQAPFNVFDRRLVTSGSLARLRTAGVEVHTRSALLQGLLVMGPNARPVFFDRWSQLWSLWDNWYAEIGATPLEAALGFVLAEPGIDRVLVGVDSNLQLREILRTVGTSRQIPPAALATEDINLINPARWKSQ